MDKIIDILNTSTAQAVVIWFFVFLSARLFKKYPKVETFYMKYKGDMLRVVKRVEKEIDDSTENKSLLKLDMALKYIIEIIESREKRMLSEEEVLQIKNNISEVHHEIDTK